MRKNLQSVLLAIVLLQFTVSANGQEEVVTKINKVTLYRYQAMVEKTATVNLQKGNNTILLRGNSNTLIRNSVNFEDNPSYLITDFTVQYNNVPYPKSWENILSKENIKVMSTIRDSIKEMKNELQAIKYHATVLVEEQATLANLPIFSKQENGDSIADWENTMNFYTDKKLALQKRIWENAEREKGLQTIIDRLYYRQDLLLQGNYLPVEQKRNEYWFAVTIVANNNIENAAINYSYMVTEATWKPIYDVKINSETHTTSFYLKGKVTQNTNEDWVNVQLVFSTEDPSETTNLQELTTFILPTYVATPAPAGSYRGNRLGNEQMIIDGVRVRESSQKEKAPIFDIDNYVTSQRSRLGQEYVVNMPQTILSANPTKSIALDDRTVNALHTYHAIPKHAKTAYLRAEIPEWESIGLLEAEAKNYLDGKYVSSLLLIPNYGKDTLLLDIGPDRRIFVDRNVTKKVQNKIGNYETTVTIEIILKNNNAQQKVEVQLQDQIPISTREEIKILAYDVAGGVRNEKTGVVTWDKIALAPQESKSITISYTVRYPKSMEFILE